MLDQSPFSLPKPPAAESDIAFAGRRLRQALVRCELAPGTYVHEGDLAQRFGLGRAAVRVALTELAGAGFVARHARQGWRVATVDGALASAIVEARLRIEPTLVETPLDERSTALLGSLRGAIDAVIGRDDPSARTMAQQLCRQALDLLAQRTGGFIAVWLRDLWDHTERLARALELAGATPPATDPRPLLDALLRGDRAAALLALQHEQKRFIDAVAHGFLAAARLLPQDQPVSVRSRRARRSTNDRKPSTTISGEKSR
ncbi:MULTISPECIES: GntR family transcriptional regulator [Bosea]|uniref:GntR family transcriptional regulator n=1 Tax=Bosea TaxID=85413 RepID=UPI00215060E1|nr:MULTISPECIES: GntR family transcriptional regulator [Bosea]MCR4523533.1 GntR family transcriptional regulator [Bosea sp. 47.2.35]MDR6830429.1 DNA-binding GntR family transcriptional regulator [Bosea robiniae]MDR6897184.1 DNA-binding GntR family transcriptional regulator [Bosea sp. BE109]MDR7140628.1 DNA-binding GntR family transcriptional regulator [Bosea sp. BE168]MDR7177325.1 DNA-binding GntR family transcriptional regulator [Bosea sp. BE271]